MTNQEAVRHGWNKGSNTPDDHCFGGSMAAMSIKEDPGLHLVFCFDLPEFLEQGVVFRNLWSLILNPRMSL
jgi:hypothetical protein